jgi:hypothetical protein
LRLYKAEKRHRVDFGECPLLKDEPLFLPGGSPLLDALFDRLPWATSGSSASFKSLKL